MGSTSSPKIQLIRNATMKLTYAGKTFLADPMLSAKDAMDPFAGIARNPTVELPFQAQEVIQGADGVIISHYHPDHFDKAASDILAKELPIFCQPGDEGRMAEEGFTNVIPIETSYIWEGITITRTGGHHGTGDILAMMGQVSGFVLQADGEPTVYWIGDTIWCEEVANTINMYHPDIIITHSGGAVIPGYDPILMDEEQTITVANAAPGAVVVAVHMEALDHCTVTRESLRQMADGAGVSSSRLLIPADGEVVSF